MKELTKLVQKGWRDMKRAGTPFSLTHMETRTAGPEYLRARLPAPYHTIALLDDIREAMISISRAGKATTNNTARPERSLYSSADSFIEKLLKLAPPAEAHSPELIAYYGTNIWYERQLAHKKWAKWQCKLCAQYPGKDRLQAHHVNYPPVFDGRESDADLICVCIRCHKIADLIRRLGMAGWPIEPPKKRKRRLSAPAMALFFDGMGNPLLNEPA